MIRVYTHIFAFLSSITEPREVPVHSMDIFQFFKCFFSTVCSRFHVGFFLFFLVHISSVLSLLSQRALYFKLTTTLLLIVSIQVNKRIIPMLTLWLTRTDYWVVERDVFHFCYFFFTISMLVFIFGLFFHIVILLLFGLLLLLVSFVWLSQLFFCVIAFFFR